jgi:KTSC domain
MKTNWMKHLLAATLITLTAHAEEPTRTPAPKETPAKATRNSGAKPGITDIQYFAQERSLKVELANGRSYVYTDVPPELAEQFAVSERKQEFLERRIRPEYDVAKPTKAKDGTKTPTAASPTAVKAPAKTEPAAKAKNPAKPDVAPRPKTDMKVAAVSASEAIGSKGEAPSAKSAAAKTPAKDTTRNKAKAPAADKAMK